MLNRLLYQGRFTQTPELKHTPTNVAVCSFTLAWNEKYGDKETVCFLNCVAYRQTAEFISKYFNKGDMALLEGKLITRSYEDKQNVKRYVTELIVDKTHFCGSKDNRAAAPIENEVEIVVENSSNPFDELPF